MATKCRFGSEQIQHHLTRISGYANINDMRGTAKTLQQPQSQYQWSLYRNLVLQLLQNPIPMLHLNIKDVILKVERDSIHKSIQST
jgi:hypothetical protein